MGMRWLITGGCGFIGTNLIRELMARGGHHVRVIDSLSSGSRQALSSVCEYKEFPLKRVKASENGEVNCELYVGDILDEEAALLLAEGVDIIVHLAANTGVGPSIEDPRQDCLLNVLGTLNYLEAARHAGTKRFVFASSGAPIGEVVPPIHEEIAPHPVSPYGASKLAGEGYCSAYFRTFGIETISLRFSNVYGSGSTHKSSVVAMFIRRAMENLPLIVYGDGDQTRDFIYVEDLVDAIILSAKTQDIGGEIFQIASNSETSINELVSLMRPLLEQAGIDGVAVEYAGKRLGDVRRNFSDVSKAQRLLGWHCRTTLANGLEKTIDWFMSSHEEQS